MLMIWQYAGTPSAVKREPLRWSMLGASQVPMSPMMLSTVSMSGLAVPGPQSPPQRRSGNSIPFDCAMPAARR